MPAVTKGKVLVSGANGYIAVWVVKFLLDQGYSVRGTVRRESSIPYLKETFKGYADMLEFVIVPDITKEGAFDEAVEGVDAIEHIASPVSYNVKDPQELIGPAVAGTVSILKSTLQYGDRVQRVVITSSTGAVLTEDVAPRTFNEENWNEQSVKEVEIKGSNAAQADIYRASKTLAERAAWKFVEVNKDKIKFDLVVFNPPYVWGPTLHGVRLPEELNLSMLAWYNTIVKGSEQFVTISSSWVDVRDVGLAHALALQKPEAGGERIIISSGAWNWQDWADAARKVEPSLPICNMLHDPKNGVYMIRYDASKSARILGLKYRGMDETVADTIKEFKEKGWLQ